MSAVLFLSKPPEWRRHAVSRTCRFVLWGVLVALAESASAGTATLGGLRFPAGSTHEVLAERIWLHGLPAQVLVFDVPKRPRDLVHVLSAQQPALADLHVLHGQLILSGLVGGDRWVAQMQKAGKERTVGSISSVSVGTVFPTQQPAWLPAGARIRLDLAVKEGGFKVSERIWQYALPLAQIAPQLEASLQNNGWTREAQPGPGQWWQRERERMQLMLVPLDAGTGLRVIGWTP